MASQKTNAFGLVGCRYAKSCDYKKGYRHKEVILAVCLNSETCNQQMLNLYGRLRERKKGDMILPVDFKKVYFFELASPKVK